MIDLEKLSVDYKEDRFYSLQLEIGDVCYQGCNYCYMNALTVPKNQLSDEIIFRILDDAVRLNISAIEWLGGEPLLRSGVFDYLKYAKDIGLKNNMWTGGLAFENKKITEKTADLCQNGLISIHLSTINPVVYKALHPDRPVSDIGIIIDGVKHLLEIGYPNDKILNSVTYTGLQTAEDMISTMDYFYKEFGISTSLNVYHTYLRPEYSNKDLEKFIPLKSEVAKVYSKYKSFLDAKDLPLNCVNKQYCSATLAVLNDGTVSSCATIRSGCVQKVTDTDLFSIVSANKDELCFKFFKDKDNLPDSCKFCKINDVCWGCRSRSFAAGRGIYGKDPRCFRRK